MRLIANLKHVIAEKLEQPTRTEGGLHLPMAVNLNQSMARVLEIGAEVTFCGRGDVIAYGNNIPVNYGGRQLVLVEEKDVLFKASQG